MSVTEPEAVVPVYQMIGDYIENLGVTQFFGLIGDDTAKFGAYLAARGLTFSSARHENAAVAMATGYADATGGLGVCILSRGPGMTNGLTAIVNAGKAGARLLIITGADPIGGSLAAIAGPDGKAFVSDGYGGPWYRQFTPESADAVATALRSAVAVAEAGLPAGLAVPKNLLDAGVVAVPVPDDGAAVRPAPPTVRTSSLDAAARALEGASRPLVIAGRGAWESGAREAIEEFAVARGALLATTLKAKDMFRESPYNLGLIGTFSHSLARRLIEASDCVLALGASLNQFTTSSGTALPDAPLIQVDLRRQNIGRYHPVDISVVGDIAAAIDGLGKRLAPLAERPHHDASILAALTDFDPRSDYLADDTRWTIDPRSLVFALDELLPTERAVVTDTGNFFGHLPPHFHVPDPSYFKCSSDFSVIGLGPGTALGVAAARPNVQTVLFVGDGSMLMALGELETLARLDLPAVFVVMNDSAYGAERHFLELQGVSGAKCMFPETDFAAIAEAIGVEAAIVRSQDDLRRLAGRLQQISGPLLLDCKVNPAVAAPFIAEGLGGAARVKALRP